jgi:hypothetical protein
VPVSGGPAVGDKNGSGRPAVGDKNGNAYAVIRIHGNEVSYAVRWNGIATPPRSTSTAARPATDQTMYSVKPPPDQTARQNAR